MTTPTETNEMEQDQWQDLAPGVDPSAYNPNPLPSNITDTVLSTPPLSSVGKSGYITLSTDKDIHTCTHKMIMTIN